MKNTKRTSIITLVLLLSIFKVYSQYMFRHWDVVDGMSDNQIRYFTMAPDVLTLAGGVGIRRTARAAKTAEAAAKDVAENIAKVNTIAAKTAETSKAAGAAAVLGSVVGVNTGKAVLVVELALLRVRKHLVCLVDLLELFLGFLVAGVIVRVVLHGQLAVSLFDLRVGGRLGYTQHFVVITFLLCHNPITSRISSNLPYIAAHCRFQYRQPQADLYKPDRPANGSLSGELASVSETERFSL